MFIGGPCTCDLISMSSRTAPVERLFCELISLAILPLLICYICGDRFITLQITNVDDRDVLVQV